MITLTAILLRDVLKLYTYFCYAFNHPENRLGYPTFWMRWQIWIGNYRPIFVLPYFPKMLEKTIYNHVYKQLDENIRFYKI